MEYTMQLSCPGTGFVRFFSDIPNSTAFEQRCVCKGAGARTEVDKSGQTLARFLSQTCSRQLSEDNPNDRSERKTPFKSSSFLDMAYPFPSTPSISRSWSKERNEKVVVNLLHPPTRPLVPLVYTEHSSTVAL